MARFFYSLKSFLTFQHTMASENHFPILTWWFEKAAIKNSVTGANFLRLIQLPKKTSFLNLLTGNQSDRLLTLAQAQTPPMELNAEEGVQLMN